jgi:hypothetical protein
MVATGDEICAVDRPEVEATAESPSMTSVTTPEPEAVSPESIKPAATKSSGKSFFERNRSVPRSSEPDPEPSD